MGRSLEAINLYCCQVAERHQDWASLSIRGLYECLLHGNHWCTTSVMVTIVRWRSQSYRYASLLGTKHELQANRPQKQVLASSLAQ